MTLRAFYFSVILFLLSSNIKCETICEELMRDNTLKIYAYTAYNSVKNLNNYDNTTILLKSEQYFAIEDRLWRINILDKQQISVYGQNQINSDSIGTKYFNHTLIYTKRYQTIVNLLVANRNKVLISALVLLEDSQFYGNLWSIWLSMSPFVIYTSENNINVTTVPFDDLSVAYIPDSFRHDSENQYKVIFIEQILGPNLSFERKYYTIKFEFSYETKNITLKLSYNRPKFLDQIPRKYYINGILNTYEYSCKVYNNCTYSAILLFTVNGVRKYCITPEESLSEMCKGSNPQTYIDCEEHNNRVFIIIIIILSVLIILFVIGSVLAFLIYLFNKSNKKSKKTIIAKQKTNIVTLEGLKKYMRRKEAKEKLLNKELSQQNDTELKEPSQSSLGFDTDEQQSFDINKPIYIKNKQ